MPALPLTSFHASPLVRLLASLHAAGGTPAPTPAQRWADWLDWTDAIALAGVLATAPTPPLQGRATATAAATAELDRVRAELADGIRSDPAFQPGAPAPDATTLPAWRRLFAARQRAMETRIGPLRAHLRAQLAARSPDGARLAALDAVLDKALAARERHLLASLATRLEASFVRAPTGADGPAAVLGPQVQAALLAELDLRLQPVQGLLGALAELQPRVTASPA